MEASELGSLHIYIFLLKTYLFNSLLAWDILIPRRIR